MCGLLCHIDSDPKGIWNLCTQVECFLFVLVHVFCFCYFGVVFLGGGVGGG